MQTIELPGILSPHMKDTGEAHAPDGFEVDMCSKVSLDRARVASGLET